MQRRKSRNPIRLYSLDEIKEAARKHNPKKDKSLTERIKDKKEQSQKKQKDKNRQREKTKKKSRDTSL